MDDYREAQDLADMAFDGEREAYEDTIARLTAELAEAREECNRRIKPEFVEGMLQSAQPILVEGYEAELSALRTERDALIGAAYEAAAMKAHAEAHFTKGALQNASAAAIVSNFVQVTQTRIAYAIEDAVRALTPTDATAALDRIKAEAELAGWKRGRADAAAALDAMAKATPLGHENPQRGASTYNWLTSHRDVIANLTPPADLAARIAKEAGNE